MSSRLTNFVEKFGLDDRVFYGDLITNSYLTHDYSSGYAILESEKEKSISFISNALDL